MPLIIFKKGTKEQLDTIASLGKLIPNEPYFLTDLNTLAIGITTTNYVLLSNVLENAIPITKGGTGADNKTDAINNLLPSQANNENKILSTDGINIYWRPFDDFSLTRNIIKNEIPIGNINGINRIFTLYKRPIPNTITLYRNGIKQKLVSNNYVFDSSDQYKYNETVNQIILTDTINPPNIINKDWIEVDYHTLEL